MFPRFPRWRPAHFTSILASFSRPAPNAFICFVFAPMVSLSGFQLWRRGSYCTPLYAPDVLQLRPAGPLCARLHGRAAAGPAKRRVVLQLRGAGALCPRLQRTEEIEVLPMRRGRPLRARLPKRAEPSGVRVSGRCRALGFRFRASLEKRAGVSPGEVFASTRCPSREVQKLHTVRNHSKSTYQTRLMLCFFCDAHPCKNQ
jgi:hypothetical protein